MKASPARDSKSGETKSPRDVCLKWGGAHYLLKCPDASEVEKKGLLRLHCAEELAKLDNRVIRQPLKQPVLSKAVGDRIITARNVIEVRILIHTAAGPVTPTQRFRCLVIEDEEFILGQDILTTLGIDVN
eukprot:jgi/Phyca11/96801/e_gw1.1.1273.1